MDMRDLYQEWKDCEEDNPVSKKTTPVITFLLHFQEDCWVEMGICKGLSFPEVLLFHFMNPYLVTLIPACMHSLVREWSTQWEAAGNTTADNIFRNLAK